MHDRKRMNVEQLECAVEAGDIFLDEFCLVDRVTIDNDKHRLGCADHQALEEFLEQDRINGAVMNHETKVAARTDFPSCLN